MNNREQFMQTAEKLVNGLLREALGFAVESTIPYYRGIFGFMVEASLLWVRHSRFPILFVAYDGRTPNILMDIVRQVEMAKANEFFALLVVVPAVDGSGNEAEELRLAVNGSVYRHDFVVLDRQHLASIIANNSARRLVEIILEQGIDLTTLSPYVIRGPVPSNMFFGREQEIKEVSQAAAQTNYALVGGRRIGKSSILHRLDRLMARDPRLKPYYLNCQDVFDYEGFFGILKLQFGDRFDGRAPQAVRHLISSLKTDTGAKHVIFLVDEVDALLDFDATTKPTGHLFSTFRALAHEHTCSFVFSGSKTLYQHLHDARSPFFNFCRDLTLGPLAEKSVAEIVIKPMRQLGVQLIDEEALIDRIIDLTSCHPSLVQWLCDQLLRSSERRVIGLEELESVASADEFHKYFVETAWGDATPLEKLISVLPNKTEFSADEIYAAAARYGLRKRNVIREALDMLRLYSLIEAHQGRFRYVLKQYPTVVRLAEDVPSLIEFWLSQVEA